MCLAHTTLTTQTHPVLWDRARAPGVPAMSEQCQRSHMHQMPLGSYPGPDGSPYPGPKTKRQLRKTSAEAPELWGQAQCLSLGLAPTEWAQSSTEWSRQGWLWRGIAGLFVERSDGTFIVTVQEQCIFPRSVCSVSVVLSASFIPSTSSAGKWLSAPALE